VPIIAALRAAIHAWRGSTHAISGIASIPGHQGERVIACISVAANQLSWVRHGWVGGTMSAMDGAT